VPAPASHYQKQQQQQQRQQHHPHERGSPGSDGSGSNSGGGDGVRTGQFDPSATVTIEKPAFEGGAGGAGGSEERYGAGTPPSRANLADASGGGGSGGGSPLRQSKLQKENSKNAWDVEFVLSPKPLGMLGSYGLHEGGNDFNDTLVAGELDRERDNLGGPAHLNWTGPGDVGGDDYAADGDVDPLDNTLGFDSTRAFLGANERTPEACLLQCVGCMPQGFASDACACCFSIHITRLLRPERFCAM
jgi:hypothetical protein